MKKNESKTIAEPQIIVKGRKNYYGLENREPYFILKKTIDNKGKEFSKAKFNRSSSEKIGLNNRSTVLFATYKSGLLIHIYKEKPKKTDPDYQNSYKISGTSSSYFCSVSILHRQIEAGNYKLTSETKSLNGKVFRYFEFEPEQAILINQHQQQPAAAAAN